MILTAALTAAPGEKERAEMLLSDALTDWQRRQVTGGVSGLAPEVARDVADIWRLIVEDTAAWTDVAGARLICCSANFSFICGAIFSEDAAVEESRVRYG